MRSASNVGRAVDRITQAYFGLMELVLVLCLGAMVIMVLGNVILRYVFNSGITVSEELSRFAFVWLVFLGAATGLRDRAHLGVDSLVRALPVRGRKVCVAISESLILLCCVLFFMGSWRQHDINVGTEAPVTGMSMAWVYGVAYVSAGTMALLVVAKLFALLTGRLSEEDLIDVVESEEQAAIDAAVLGKPGHKQAAVAGLNRP